MIEHLVHGVRRPALPALSDDWHHHPFSPHGDRPHACIVCGRLRVWRWHFGPWR